MLVIFTVSTQCILHASGKHVSSILSYLQPVLDDKQRTTLMAYHGKIKDHQKNQRLSTNRILIRKIHFADLVLKLLSSEGDTAKEAANNIEGMMKDVKEIATNFKKAGVTVAD